MYFRDHNPPHFHVDITDGRALVGIGDLNVIEGRVSAAALNEAREWAEKNMDRLLTAWVEYR